MKPPALLSRAALLWAARPALADPFRLGVWVRDRGGRVVDSQRIWYGDGTSPGLRPAPR